MNAWEQRKSETCSATSSDKSSSEEKKQSAKNILGSIRKALGHDNSSESKGPWSSKEHSAFLDGLYRYGLDWIQIAVLVKSRTAEEVMHHFHSFQQEEPFLFRLRKMLDDKSLDKIIAWQAHGRSFEVFNRAFIRVALPLYFGAYFRDMSHFQEELYAYGFRQDFSHSGFAFGVWFHPQFLRDSPLEMKRQFSTSIKCCNNCCKKSDNPMRCTGCRCVHYCSEECQQLDWSAHMWVCGIDMSDNEKSASESNKIGVLTKAVPEETSQSEVKASATAETQKPSKEDTNIDKGKSSSEELKGQALQSRVFNNSLCKNTDNLMRCAGMDTSTEGNSFDHNTQVIPEESNQTKAKAISTSNTQKPLKEDKNINYGEWSTDEHRHFLEGLDRFGILWEDIASHVKTRTVEQVRNHFWNFLKKLNSYWTTKEHQLFLEGLENYGRGHWEEIASHVETKNNLEVSFHAKEYFEEIESKGKPQKNVDGSEKDSPAAREFLYEPNRILFTGDGSNAKRSRDQEDTITQSSKKRKSMESMRQKHIEQSIVTPEKHADQEQMQNVIFSLKPFHQKTNELQNGHETTCSDSAVDADVYEISCPICLEMFNDPHIVPECCHRFCKGCIEEALEYRKECPICRGRVTSRRALRRDEVFGNLLRLSEEYKVNNMAASAKLQEKNYRIQHIESRQKEDEKRLENVHRAFQRLEKELKEKNSKIESFENLVQTLFDRNKGKLESIANEVKDLQTQLQQKNQTIYDLQVQLHENDDRIYDLQSHLQENDYVIYDLQSHLQENDYVIYDLKSQLHENDHRIQYLESKGKVDEDKRQFVSEANKHLETQLEEEKTRSNALWKLSRTLYDKHNIESMAAELREVQSQLQEKNERIQHLESREKTDEERLEHVKHLEKTFEDLQALLDEKNERIQHLESREKTEEERLEHVEHLEKTFGDLQALLDEKNERIHYLESREKADKEKIQCLSKSSEHLETQVEEKNARIEVLEELARTLGDEHEIESMATAVRDLQSQLQEKQSQLQEKNDKIQKLESKQKADEERLEHITKAIEYLEKEVEEKNAEIRILEEIRTHSDVHKLESMAAAVKDLQSQLQEKNVRIQLLESRKQKVEVIEEEKTIDLPLVFDTNDMPGQAAENETKRGSIHSKPKTPEQELAALETSGVPLFLIKTYQLISTCSDQLADWSDNGETFTVKDTAQFAKVEIPKYFNHNNFSSFSRQLNFYGFSKVSLKTIRVDHVRFHNQNFRKGKIHLLSKIKRSTGKKANVNHAQEIKESSKKKTLGIPIFLQKTYHMIDSCDPTIASWSDSGDSFAVKDPDTFAKNIIPQFFKHNNFKSFVRQLNVYGFRKIKNEPIKISIGEEGPESKYCRFRHEFFLRGRPDLLCEIKKVDNSQGADQDVVNALKNEVTSLKGQLAAMRGEMEKAVNMIKTMSQNKQEADETMSAAPIHPAIGSCDEEPMAEVEISFETPLEAIDVTKPTQEACVKEKEETRVQTKDDENVMNANTEAKW
ncbi:hypothetical protein CTEN210_03598 [Chaetoceros tenuissimus]|uniref:RING-type E3 ubiquitin transferase n=1 Tax=Chaetoceros tenuissimus TaxID=426638 RepID=A0AAD3CJM7_9STRA|nr:hypothetical protein CTEN210_03598 [Chaetoceros tenuissimus]